MPRENQLENPYQVRLVNSAAGGGRVHFQASPTISENRNVNWNSL